MQRDYTKLENGSMAGKRLSGNGGAFSVAGRFPRALPKRCEAESFNAPNFGLGDSSLAGACGRGEFALWSRCIHSPQSWGQ